VDEAVSLGRAGDALEDGAVSLGEGRDALTEEKVGSVDSVSLPEVGVFAQGG
jgi:hypothetical protein